MDIPPALLGTGGPVGLIAVVVALVLTGRLMTRAAHEDRIRDHKDRITYLEATLSSRDDELRVRGQQVDKLLAQSELTVQLLQSIAREAGHDDLAA